MNQLPCPVCSETLSVRIATGRKSGKAFLIPNPPKDTDGRREESGRG